ncbi:MAG: efflux transporter outer membrane subunit [Proteobacteria bacterium]|nr:efflux transporter outer membrane subunit [Pseudomonadota bacterium]
MRPLSSVLTRALASVCLATLLAILAFGCTLAPKYERPSPLLPPDWTSGTASRSQANATLPDWRQVVTDEPMRRLVELALQNNRDLRVAALKIEKAQAQYRIARADLLPDIGAAAQADMQRTPASLSGKGVPVTSRAYSVGLAFSTFELDFFGRIQSLKDQALEEFLATEASRRSVELSLVAEVATAYLTLAADREHLALAREILTTERESYEIVRQKSEFGVVGDLDLKRAQTTVDSARVAEARYLAQVTEDENLLAMLVGLPLSPEQTPAQTLAGVAPLAPVPAALPSEVLTRRPDVLAAEHQLKAANASIGAARARYFPTISLTGGYGTASNEINGLFKNGATAWSFVPQLTLPIFNAGAIRAGVEVAEADRSIMLAQYEKTVQTAFREVSNALAQGASLTAQAEAQASLAEATGASYELATLRYEAGVDGYLSKLDAQRSNASARQDLIGIRLTRQGNLLTLYKALGGAWSEEGQAN